MIFNFQLMEIKLIFPHSSKVFDLGRGTPTMVTGLEYFRLRPAGESQSTYGVLVTTMTKFYQFQGNLNNKMDEKPFLQPLFHAYLNTKGKIG